MRVYDDPTHMRYGPVRRLWVMLAGLYGADLTKLDEAYKMEWGKHWDVEAVRLFSFVGPREGLVLRTILWRALNAYDPAA